MPILTTTRDAIVTLLNAQSFTPSVPATPAYESNVNLDQFSGARLLVIPREAKNELLTFAAGEQRDPVFDVVLQSKAATLKTSELDPYLTLAETILETLLGAELPDASTRCTEVAWPEGTWNAQHLEKYQVLTIVLACTVTST